MPRMSVLACPSCGASLSVEDGEAQIQCQFCGSTVIVPEELRPAPPTTPSIHITVGAPSGAGLGQTYSAPTSSRHAAAVILGIFLALLAAGTLIGVAILFNLQGWLTGQFVPSLPSLPPEIATLSAAALPTPGPAAASTPAFADVALTFGAEGTGPGLFQDARGIALDAEGNLYVSEYETGRVQKFDSQGQFLRSWITEGETPLRGLAADRAGNLYVVRGGAILQYTGATGALVRKFEGDDHFDDVVALPDGGLLACACSGADDIVRLNSAGELVSRTNAAISGQTGDHQSNVRLAVDGLGNILALSSRNEAVFIFDPDGRFVSRFGSDGDEPGQFRAPYAIAVDGQSRVYVSDFKGIQVFDPQGRYLALIDLPTPGIAFGLVFNDRNDLFAVARDRVHKFILNAPVK